MVSAIIIIKKHSQKCSRILTFVSLQGFYQLLEPKVTIRCRKQDVQLVQVSIVMFDFFDFSCSLDFLSLLYYILLYFSLSGFNPEEYSHIQSCCEEQPGGSHRPEQLPVPGHVSSISAISVARTAPAVDPNFGFMLRSAPEAWRSTTVTGRSKCLTPWRAGWTSWLSRYDQFN